MDARIKGMFPPDAAAWGGTLAVSLVIYWIYVNRWNGSGIDPDDRATDIFNHVTYPIKALLLLLQNLQPPNIYLEVRTMKVQVSGLWDFIFETPVSQWDSKFHDCDKTLEQLEDEAVPFAFDHTETTSKRPRHNVDMGTCPTFADVYVRVLEQKEKLCDGDLHGFVKKIKGLQTLLTSVRNTVLSSERRKHDEMTVILHDIQEEVEKFCTLLNAFTQNTTKDVLMLESSTQDGRTPFWTGWKEAAVKYNGEVKTFEWQDFGGTPATEWTEARQKFLTGNYSKKGKPIAPYKKDDRFKWRTTKGPNHAAIFEDLKKSKKSLEEMFKKI
jgi:hypothetical protein